VKILQAFVCALFVLLLSRSVAATPQRWPFLFDPNIAADPAGTGQAIASGAASLPELPVAAMKTLQTGAVTLWFWPESAALLNRIAAAGPGVASWPTTPVMCKKHDSFVVPTLLGPGASASCASADSDIRQQLASLGACDAVEQPERYALGYNPNDARKDTGTLEDMIGLAGEGLSHPPLPGGLLPDDFVPTLRALVAKIRHDKLVQAIAGARAAYAQAAKLGSDNAACFDPTALASLQAAIVGLDGELDAAQAWLDKLDSDGKAAHAQEDVCLAAHSRVRNPLPFPSLTAADRRTLAFWLGGIYWRMRGGGLIPLGATQDARIYFLLQPFTQIGLMSGGQDGSDAAFDIYLQIFEGWSDWQDMGNAPGGDKYADLVSMTSRGQRQIGTAVTLLGGRSYDTLALNSGGLQMGPCYYYAYYPLAAFRYAETLTTPYSGFIDWPTAVGEFCYGASMGLGFADTLLGGKATGQPPTVTLCTGKSCGDDGCGESCGSCAKGSSCSPAGQCVAGACVPTCGGAVCGDDGCGGSCGSCAAGSTCNAGACVPGSSDAGTGGNGETTPPATASPHGCGCSTVPRDAERAPWLAVFAAAALALIGRRARSRQSGRAAPRKRRRVGSA
jgi:hypothetical protein